MPGSDQEQRSQDCVGTSSCPKSASVPVHFCVCKDNGIVYSSITCHTRQFCNCLDGTPALSSHVSSNIGTQVRTLPNTILFPYFDSRTHSISLRYIQRCVACVGSPASYVHTHISHGYVLVYRH